MHAVIITTAPNNAERAIAKDVLGLVSLLLGSSV